MPSALKIFLITLSVLLVLAICLLVVLAGTPGGTRLLSDQVRSLSGEAIDWDSLDGTLLGSLQLRGVQYRQPGISVGVRTILLNWQPGALLAGRLQVEQLDVEGVTVDISGTAEDDPSDAPPLRPEHLQLPLDIALEQVLVRDLQLRIGDQPAQQFDRIVLAMSLEGPHLQLRQLELRTPQGGLAARGEAQLAGNLPLDLGLDWEWTLPDERTIGGEFYAGGNTGALAIRHRGTGDLPIDIQGELRQFLTDPAWELELSWPQLPLDLSTDPLLLGPARVSSSGSADGYTLGSEGGFAGMGLEPGSWSLQASGTLDGLTLEPLVLSVPRLGLELRGGLDWSGPVAADLAYSLAGDQLADLGPQLPQRLKAQGELQARFEGEELSLQRLTLALEQATLNLAVTGTVRLPDGGDPVLDGRLQWQDLGWPIAIAEPELASPRGELNITGTPDNYQLSLSAAVAGTQLPAGEWRAQGSGDTSELRLQQLRGELLDGELDLSGTVGWDPQIEWNLQAQGSDLDPGLWLPDLPGRLLFALYSSGRIDPERGVLGEVELERMAGQLAGRELQLATRAVLDGEAIEIKSLHLDSGGNRLEAQGSISPQLDLGWQLRVQALAALVPGAGGQIQANGQLEGSPEQPRLRLSLRSDALSLDALSLSELEGELQAGLGPDDPLQLDVALGAVQEAGEPLLEAAKLVGRGSTTVHRLYLSVQGVSDSLAVRLEGGLDSVEMAWNGTLASLGIDSGDYGAWQLTRPAPLALSASRASIGETCLRSDPEAGQVCTRGEWLADGNSTLAAQLQALPLNRLLPNLEGELEGDLNLGLAADGRLQAEGEVEMNPGRLRLETASGGKYLEHNGGRLRMAIGEAGLNATLQLDSVKRRLVDAAIRLPNLNRLPIPDPQPLEGHLRAQLEDLSGLSGLVPELSNTAGRLDADLRLAGTLEQPLILGEMAVAGAAADIPMAGLQLRQLALRATGKKENPGVIELEGGLVSGPGRVDLDGILDLTGADVALNLKGDRLQIYNTPDARVLASPDLQIGWSEELLTLRGSVFIPEAAITPKLALNPAMVTGDEEIEELPGQVIASSADVVILDSQGELVESSAEELAIRIDSQVELILGDDVKVNALGLIARIGGGVVFTNEPGQKDMIPRADGRLSIEDGTFRAFGQDLDIETGRVIFAGVPVTEPELGIRAVRWIDNDPQVSAAGVAVTGTLTEPFLELFSRPQLDPTEVQSYLLTGRSSGDRDTVLSIGTYLHPKVYVGYGYNLIEGTSEFNGHYTITPRYGVGASVGEFDNNVNLTITYER